MKKDELFLAESTEQINIPESFISEHLSKINDPDLFKLLLYIFWRFDKEKSQVKYITIESIIKDLAFSEFFGKSSNEIKIRILELLTKAIEQAILIICPNPEQAKIDLYFYNSIRNQEIIELIKSGDLRIENLQNISLASIKPNVFKIYEENIGPLTPMIAETLEDASNNFPINWINEAIQIAVENNVRRWKYIQAILDRWQEEGKDARRDQKSTQEDREKYLKGKYSGLIKH
jgi:DnaD/phage-associated family protein